MLPQTLLLGLRGPTSKGRKRRKDGVKDRGRGDRGREGRKVIPNNCFSFHNSAS